MKRWTRLSSVSILALGLGCQSPKSDESNTYTVTGIETDSKDPEVLYSVHAFQFYLVGKWREMLQISDEWTKLHPMDSVGWMNKGIALSRMGRSEWAILPLRKAVELEPEAARAWNELADVLDATGDGQGAEAARSKASEILSKQP